MPLLEYDKIASGKNVVHYEIEKDNRTNSESQLDKLFKSLDLFENCLLKNVSKVKDEENTKTPNKTPDMDSCILKETTLNNEEFTETINPFKLFKTQPEIDHCVMVWKKSMTATLGILKEELKMLKTSLEVDLENYFELQQMKEKCYTIILSFQDRLSKTLDFNQPHNEKCNYTEKINDLENKSLILKNKFNELRKKYLQLKNKCRHIEKKIVFHKESQPSLKLRDENEVVQNIKLNSEAI